MTSYDRQSMESAIAAETVRGKTFEIHEADLAYTLGLTLPETSLPNIEAAMQPFLGENEIAVEYDKVHRSYVFMAQNTK